MGTDHVFAPHVFMRASLEIQWRAKLDASRVRFLGQVPRAT
jgi:hypothetical protein